MNARIEDPAAIMEFMLAGSALFSLKSVKTGQHFTYQVSRAKDDGKQGTALTWVVGLLTGPDNNADYNYIGIVRARGDDDIPKFRTTAKTRNPNSASVKGFEWFTKQVFENGTHLSQVECWHAGKCGRCKRTLTDPESIRSGIGPVCRTKSQS